MKNIEVYNKRLSLSMIDKTWFTQIISLDEPMLVVDFGCGNGDVMRFLNNNFNIPCIGYDTNKEMISIGLNKWDNNSYCNNWEEVLDRMSFYPRHKKILLFSSVLHEIKDKIILFESLNLEYFDYIVIRDMYFSYTSPEKHLFAKYQEQVCEKLPLRLSEKVVDDSSLIQCIMKSYYIENIETEILEDYFSLKAKHITFLANKFPGYDRKLYVLPYWLHIFKKDWGIELHNVSTHIQLIFHNLLPLKLKTYNVKEHN